MSSTTYTMLVTIAHDDGAAPSAELLEVIVQRGLEEGVREFAGVHAVSVSSFAGDRLECRPGTVGYSAAKGSGSAKRMHAALRA